MRYSEDILISAYVFLPVFHLILCVCGLPREAEGYKEQGNAYYVKKDYSEAFNYYTKAIGN